MLTNEQRIKLLEDRVDEVQLNKESLTLMHPDNPRVKVVFNLNALGELNITKVTTTENTEDIPLLTVIED